MRTITFIILYVAALVLGVATFIEAAYGTPVAQDIIYGTAWFKTLWTIFIVLMLMVLYKMNVWKRFHILILHIAFACILIGALTTAISSEKGMLHLRVNAPLEKFVDKGKHLHQLPFTLRLDSFKVEYYEGTEAPADYVSHITCNYHDDTPDTSVRVSMNKIFSSKGYRLYQTSYDEDMQGSWLTVNHDPWGTSITYAGFILLVIGMICSLCSPQSRFRKLLRHPLLKKSCLIVLFSCSFIHAHAENSLPVVNRRQADSLRTQQVIYHDRTTILNTLAHDFVQKVYGKTSYKGVSAEQIISSWMLYPDAWNNTPIIYIKDATLRKRLNIEGDYARLTDLYDQTEYKLQAIWQQEKTKQSKLSKAIRETDEKVGLILMLLQGQLIRPIPNDVTPLHEHQVVAELLYNNIPFSKILFMVNLTLGILAFGLLLYRILRQKEEGHISRSIWKGLLVTATLFHIIGYGLRWYICGNVPLSNGYETMQFVALCILIIGCLLYRRFPYTRPFAFLLSGFTLLVAYLGQMNPQITPLMPVLISPWLSYHVSLIMMSYALFAFIWLNAVLSLFLSHRYPHENEQVERLTILSRLLLYPATFLLGIGIILGSVWANESWGSYWSWDPKEVWALVAFIIYGIPLHTQSMKCWRNTRTFHIYMFFAFFVILMTYFGVNYLLGGMHSYAN